MGANINAIWIGGKPTYLPAYSSPPEPNTIACDGDSITASGNTYAVLLTSRYTVNNNAVAGATIVGNSGNSITDRGSAFDTLRVARTPAIIWCGTNSLQNGVSGSNCLTQMASYLAARRTAGWTKANGNPIIGINCMPRLSAGFPESERTIFNAGFTSLDFDYFIDASAGVDGTPGDGILWSSDKIHPTVMGQQWLFDRWIMPQILSLRF